MSLKYCAAFPCPNLAVDGAYCGEHRPARTPKQADFFYLTPQWRRFRDWYIGKHPLCELCEREGRLTPTDMVDHIVELKDGGALTTEKNAMAMCWKCHGIKTASNKSEKHNKNHQLGYQNNRWCSAKVS
jgi:5-methylcytosine-specific restriction protein A